MLVSKSIVTYFIVVQFARFKQNCVDGVQYVVNFDKSVIQKFIREITIRRHASSLAVVARVVIILHQPTFCIIPLSLLTLALRGLDNIEENIVTPMTIDILYS